MRRERSERRKPKRRRCLRTLGVTTRALAVAARSSRNAAGRTGDDMIDERLKEKLLSMTWEGLRRKSFPAFPAIRRLASRGLMLFVR